MVDLKRKALKGAPDLLAVQFTVCTARRRSASTPYASNGSHMVAHVAPLAVSECLSALPETSLPLLKRLNTTCRTSRRN